MHDKYYYYMSCLYLMTWWLCFYVFVWVFALLLYIFWAVNISINNNLILSCTSLHIYQLFHSLGRRDSRFEPDLVTDLSNNTSYLVKLGTFTFILHYFLLFATTCPMCAWPWASRSLGWASPPMLCEPTFIKSIQHVSHSASNFISIKLFIITRHSELSSQGEKNSFKRQETNKV